MPSTLTALAPGDARTKPFPGIPALPPTAE
jgi:hypothetical protein